MDETGSVSCLLQGSGISDYHLAGIWNTCVHVQHKNYLTHA